MPKDTAKVGRGTVKKGPISTPFKDCVAPKPDQRGVWATVTNGEEITGGSKGTPGEMTEVTIAGVHGGGARGPTKQPKQRFVISPKK